MLLIQNLKHFEECLRVSGGRQSHFEVDSIVSVVLLCKVKYPAAVLLVLGTEPCTAHVEM